LKANAIGKLKGLKAQNALQFVADNYPNSEEGKSPRNSEGPNSVLEN
jgi:hypothetical protein